MASTEVPVAVWDVRSGTRTTVLAGSPPQSYGVAFNADGTRIATATTDPDKVLRVVDAATGQVAATYPGSVAAHGLAFSPRGDVLAFSHPTARAVVLWPVSGGSPRSLTGHSDAPHAVAFAPDGTALYSASSHDGILRWDPAAGTLLARFERPAR